MQGANFNLCVCCFMRGQVFFEKTTRPRTPTLKNFLTLLLHNLEFSFLRKVS